MSVCPPPRTVLGRHTLVELYGCDIALLNDAEGMRALLLRAATIGGATIVKDIFHRFSPHGVTGVVVIAESHLAVHTWPEHGYAAVDLFTCGTSVDTAAVHAELSRGLGATETSTTEIARGV